MNRHGKTIRIIFCLSAVLMASLLLSQEVIADQFEVQDSCVTIRVDNFEKTNNISQHFESVSSPSFGNEYFLLELTIMKINCGYLYINLGDMIDYTNLLDDKSSLYSSFAMSASGIQMEDPTDFESNSAFEEGSSLIVAFEVPVNKDFVSIELGYYYGSTWSEANNPNFSTISFNLSDQNSTESYNLEIARVEYRDQYESGEDHTRVAVMFTDQSGNYVNPNVNSWSVTYMGQEIELLSPWEGSYYSLEGTYNESTGQWQFADSLTKEYYLRVKIAPSNDFSSVVAPSGTYNLSLSTSNGVYTGQMTFNGKVDLPRINASTFKYVYNVSGDLTISWDLPDQTLFPDGAQFNLVVEDYEDWSMAGYFTMPCTVDSITIPKSVMELIGDPDRLAVKIRTQDKDRSNRVYSATVSVRTADISVQPENEGWVIVKGTVNSNNSPVCAMALANGQYMFTCKDGDDFGKYALEVPLDGNGQVTIQAFVSGLSPFRQTISSTTADINIAMQPADPESKSPTVTTQTTSDASTPSGWVRIMGTVELDGAPLCAMVLANGKYMFSCGVNSGVYDLTIPLDSNGQITHYVFVSGLRPYKQTFTP